MPASGRPPRTHSRSARQRRTPGERLVMRRSDWEPFWEPEATTIRARICTCQDAVRPWSARPDHLSDDSECLVANYGSEGWGSNPSGCASVFPCQSHFLRAQPGPGPPSAKLSRSFVTPFHRPQAAPRAMVKVPATAGPHQQPRDPAGTAGPRPGRGSGPDGRAAVGSPGAHLHHRRSTAARLSGSAGTHTTRSW
jgi:hypothetical protein